MREPALVALAAVLTVDAAEPLPLESGLAPLWRV